MFLPGSEKQRNNNYIGPHFFPVCENMHSLKLHKIHQHEEIYVFDAKKCEHFEMGMPTRPSGGKVSVKLVGSMFWPQ